MKSKIVNISTDFSPSPAGRYESDGPFPGEIFRDKLLIPAIQNNDSVTVDLDGTDGYGSSFLEEAFGGLIRKGYTEKLLRKKMHVHSTRKSYEVRVWNYIHDACLRT